MHERAYNVGCNSVGNRDRIEHRVSCGNKKLTLDPCRQMPEGRKRQLNQKILHLSMLAVTLLFSLVSVKVSWWHYDGSLVIVAP